MVKRTDGANEVLQNLFRLISEAPSDVPKAAAPKPTEEVTKLLDGQQPESVVVANQKLQGGSVNGFKIKTAQGAYHFEFATEGEDYYLAVTKPDGSLHFSSIEDSRTLAQMEAGLYVRSKDFVEAKATRTRNRLHPLLGKHQPTPVHFKDRPMKMIDVVTSEEKARFETPPTPLHEPKLTRKLDRATGETVTAYRDTRHEAQTEAYRRAKPEPKIVEENPANKLLRDLFAETQPKQVVKKE